LSWLLDFSLSKLLKISVADLQALLISWFGDAVDWFGGVLMHLKLFVLSASSVVLWLAPLVVLDKRLDIHKALQGVSLTAAIACAVSAGNIARELSEQGKLRKLKSEQLLLM
jgi:hypothetical protein